MSLSRSCYVSTAGWQFASSAPWYPFFRTKTPPGVPTMWNVTACLDSGKGGSTRILLVKASTWPRMIKGSMVPPCVMEFKQIHLVNHTHDWHNALGQVFILRVSFLSVEGGGRGTAYISAQVWQLNELNWKKHRVTWVRIITVNYTLCPCPPRYPKGATLSSLQIYTDRHMTDRQINREIDGWADR